jgi:hypothetical protein
VTTTTMHLQIKALQQLRKLLVPGALAPACGPPDRHHVAAGAVVEA